MRTAICGCGKRSAADVSRGERPMEAGRSATAQLQEARAEARAATARAAEADARLAAAQKQLHTVRGGASAAQTALQEEIQSLKVRLAPPLIIARLLLCSTKASHDMQFNGTIQVPSSFATTVCQLTWCWHIHRSNAACLCISADMKIRGHMIRTGDGLEGPRTLTGQGLSAQASLAQEKAGRARIVESLRSTIGGLRAAGDVEGRLKAELVAAHEQFASAQAALEAAEGRASDRHRCVT